MRAQDAYSCIKARRTSREYIRRRVSRSVISKIIRAATLAPSAHNSQPWLFYLIDSERVRRNLVDSMLHAWEVAMTEDGRGSELINVTLAKFKKRFISAPVLIVCALDRSLLYFDRYREEGRKRYEEILGHHSLAAAVENALLMATALGVSACWYSAPLFCQDAVRNVLQLDKEVEPAILLTLGYARSKPRPKRIRPLALILRTV